MVPKYQETIVVDKAITTMYNKIGFVEFCEIIGQETEWKPGTLNNYALEKFQIFQEAVRDISQLGDFWTKLMEWAIENPID